MYELDTASLRSVAGGRTLASILSSGSYMAYNERGFSNRGVMFREHFGANGLQNHL